MTVELINYTPLGIAIKAIRRCWASEDKSDSNTIYNTDGFAVCEDIGKKDIALIDRVANKNKHSSTIEHLVYTFDIDDISRALLQELARHRMASLSVKSTRYTLKELKEEYSFINGIVGSPSNIERPWKYMVKVGNRKVDNASISALEELRKILVAGISNDKAKYCLPEAYKTGLVYTINARSLQNLLNLRTDKSVLWEFRELANAMYEALPKEHKFLFKHCVKEIDES